MGRHAVVAIALAAGLGLTAACGGGGGQKATPGASPSGGAEGTVPSSPAALPTSATESGKEPIYWRTADNFGSMRAGKPYKVLFRITNGYAAPTLTVTATCQTCPNASDRQPRSFEGHLAQPVGGDLPGSFYPINITLPQAGRWQIDVTAGADSTRIMVDVLAGASPS